jgi:hypothetical protein
MFEERAAYAEDVKHVVGWVGRFEVLPGGVVVFDEE